MPNQQAHPSGACEVATLNQLQTRLRRAIVQEPLHCQAISGALRGERQALLDTLPLRAKQFRWLGHRHSVRDIRDIPYKKAGE